MLKPIGSKKERLFDRQTKEIKIASVLSKYPYMDFTLSEIARKAHVSKSMASSIIQKMKKEEFIILEEIGEKMWRIRANIENPHFKEWKILNNLSLIFESPIIGFLSEHFNPKAIILFGSFRWGEDGRDSDIDIAVEVLEDKELEIISLKKLAKRLKDMKFSKGAERFEKDIERNVQVHIFNKKHINTNLFNSIANGIVLDGFLEVRKL